MEYVAKLLENWQFRQLVNELEDLEQDRQYCRHDFAHFMDVARLAVLVNLQEDLGFEQEMLYLAALLHDLGRVQEYKNGTSHDQAGAQIAETLLTEIGYPREKQQIISEAIRHHRGKREEAPGKNAQPAEPTAQGFSHLIRSVDKKVRPCFLCKAQRECNWSNEKRNTAESWR